MNKHKWFLLVIFATLLATLPLSGSATQLDTVGTITAPQSEAPEGTDWILPGVERYDAEMLAEQHNITSEESAEMLSRQPAIGQLRAKLAARTDGNFAGLWVTGTNPKTQRVTIAFKQNLDEELANLQADFPYPELLEVTTAERSYDELWKIYQETIAQRNSLATIDAQRIDIALSEEANEVHVYAPTDIINNVATVLNDDPAVKVFESIQESKLESTTTIRGGVTLRTCTAGFIVVSGGSRGVTTASHCNDIQNYGGTSVGTVVKHQYGYNIDLQIHGLGSNWAPRNEIELLWENRVINDRSGHSSLFEGQYICKHGKNTGDSCGSITEVSTSQAKTPNSDKITAADYISASGDSGGPVFSSNTALGTHIGSLGNGDAVFGSYSHWEYGFNWYIMTTCC